MLEAKYQHAAFADPWVAQEVERLLTLTLLSAEIAKAIHHILAEPGEQATELIEQLYLTHARTLSESSLLPGPLAPLPKGVTHPFLERATRHVDDEETELLDGRTSDE
jgi:hypothetical protein